MRSLKSFSQLISHLHRGGTYGFWCYESVACKPHKPDSPKERASIWWECQRPSQLPAHKGQHGLRNVWFGVHPSYDIPETNRFGDVMDSRYLRSQNHLIAAINCLFAEFDAKDHGSKKNTADHIFSLPYRPSVVIDSGGGYHAYWLLEEPHHLRRKLCRMEARDLQFAWVDFVGGDGRAKNLNRVLRIPGYRNCKEAYAPDYPTVSFVTAQLDRQYTLSTLRAALMASGDLHEEEAPDPRPATPEEEAIWLLLGQAMQQPISDGIETYQSWSKNRYAQKKTKM